ncbi:MAG: bifunctional diaminohydroxyphosphoribosylaminopyrimidine deaminase/5-amino-6-(5-phosphoribosylamino)uracil reductase RibD [Peptococcaceae bacterium]|nr:bifunctional diaminohydroxyphosphoribosylaminopyrimidine deaminase/5-amino-6-(5-phosphoribosylamino)uracil reductase RibD [Peptococcaceae bacterium]
MSVYMAEALRLAALAIGRTSPNPLVGAVVVRDDKIIGRGYHQKAGTPHAEIHALAEAGKAARGATVYVTLEPCSHHGRTPPCSDALIKAEVNKVVIAMRDPNPLVAGEGIAQLQRAGIVVEVGDQAPEAARLNEVFLKYIATKLPFVTFKTAMSLDGKIATAGGESRWITGSETRQWVHRLRDCYDAILVGSGTVLADNPELTARIPNGRNPIRLVVDSRLRIPLSAKLLSGAQTTPVIIATTHLAPQAKIAALQALGVQIMRYESAQVPLPQFFRDLGQIEITSILCEGGSTLAAALFTQALIDKVHFCIAPKIIGGDAAPGPIGGNGIAVLKDALQLHELDVQHHGSDLILTGYPVHA